MTATPELLPPCKCGDPMMRVAGGVQHRFNNKADKCLDRVFAEDEWILFRAPIPDTRLREAANAALSEMQWLIVSVEMSRNSHDDPFCLKAHQVEVELAAALAAIEGKATPNPHPGGMNES